MVLSKVNTIKATEVIQVNFEDHEGWQPKAECGARMLLGKCLRECW